MEESNLYIELLKHCVLDAIYDGLTQNRLYGKDWPIRAHTMIGKKRLDNIQFCFEDVIKNNIDGDIIETGVWRGGACIFIKGLITYYKKNNKLFVADSFQGLPPPSGRYDADKNDKHHTKDIFKVGLEEVKNNFLNYNLLDNNVIFLKGWFKDTLPTLINEKFSIVRLDGDMYESTIDSINVLYPKLNIGGYLIVDDYIVLNGCQQAINDYRSKNNIKEDIINIDNTGVFWKKER